ncbi:MAG: phosphoserine phosphatase SerB [Candidatus Hermodarchaeia archaeon]|jgi:phosphoserine phosphatase SerB
MIKIRVFDAISPHTITELRNIAEVIEKGWDFDVAIVRSTTKITKDFVDRAVNLKMVLRAGVGLDNIDQEYCKLKKIEVRNTAQASTISVAELVFALLLSIARKIVQKTDEVRKGYWRKEGGFELSGKTMGIIGYGNIGQEVAKRAASFGMTVIAYDPFITKANVPILGLKELLHVSDIITLHVPLNESTREIISSETINEMKDGIILINTSRGGVVNENDLYNALLSEKISFAGLDVFQIEPPHSKLIELTNVVLTPHIGGSTIDASDRVGEAVIEQVKEFIKKRVEDVNSNHQRDNFYLMTVSSEDRPGITATLTEILSRHEVAILDAEQATIQGILALSFLVEMDTPTKNRVTQDLQEKAAELALNLKVTPFAERKTRKKVLYALTCLTSVPRGEVLTYISQILFQNSVNIETIRQLTGEDLVALELSVDVSASKNLEKLKQDIMRAGKELRFDVALQSEEVFRKSKRLIIFNLEGVLTDLDLINEIAKVAGLQKNLNTLMEHTLNQGLSAKQTLKRRVALLKGISANALEYIATKIQLTKGTRQLITLLKRMGFKIGVISSAFTFFTERIQEELDLDYAYGNECIISDNHLSGNLTDPIIDGPEKTQQMIKIAEEEGILLDQVVVVGNGIDDIEMLSKAGLGIVFQTKGEYLRNIGGSIVQTNLKSILYMLGASEESFT